MIGLRITPISPEWAPLTPAVMVDILWAGVLPEDRVEHIFMGPSCDLINVVFFQRFDSFVEARDKVLELWQRVTERSKLLQGKYDVEICSLEWD
jgi:hypothetical protein